MYLEVAHLVSGGLDEVAIDVQARRAAPCARNLLERSQALGGALGGQPLRLLQPCAAFRVTVCVVPAVVRSGRQRWQGVSSADIWNN